MFTGIIEEIGKVVSFKKSAHGADLKISAKTVLEDVKLGESIAVNGVCETVVAFDNTTFEVNVSDETLRVSNLSNLKQGDFVNLERALKLSDRLSGHIVSGHVDLTTKFIKKEKLGEFYNMEFAVTPDFRKYIVKKGSITINGISLTVAEIQDRTVTVAVIPHTYENTNLSEMKIGSVVNIETDVFAKYIEKFLLNEKTTSIISEDFLKENGFM